jgi:hypothetical protein
MSDGAFTLYRTSDIHFAAFLCSLDIPMKATEDDKRGDKPKKVFIFEMKETDKQRMKTLYFSGTGTVKARTFVDNLRSLKSMCYV